MKKVFIIILVFVVLIAVSSGIYKFFNKDVRFAPDDGVCDPGEDVNGEDCQGIEPPCDINDPNGNCYSPPPCTGVSPSPECGNNRGVYIDTCNYCDSCGVLDTQIANGNQPVDQDGKVDECNVCSGGKIVGAPAGQPVSGNPCQMCDGAGGITSAPDGRYMACAYCESGVSKDIVGNNPLDTHSLECTRCNANHEEEFKPAGEFCNIYVGGNFIKYAKGECDGLGICGPKMCNVNSCTTATQSQLDSWGATWADKLFKGLDLGGCKITWKVVFPGTPQLDYKDRVSGVCVSIGF